MTPSMLDRRGEASVATPPTGNISPRHPILIQIDVLVNRPAWFYGIIFVWFLATAVLYHRRLLTAWFTADEVDILGNIDGRSIGQILTAYDVSGSNFVPMLLVSLKLDWMLFEWQIPGFRLHSILAACFAAVMLVALLRRWCAWPTAVLAGLAFLISVDTAALIGYTASRHYIEGLVPALATIMLTLRYMDRGTILSLAGAAACYFLATLFKEIYAPLPALIFALPGESNRKRALLLAVFALPSITYLAYRRSMIGQFVGGYGAGQYDPWHVVTYFLRAWPRFTGWMIFGTSRWHWMLVIPANALLILAIHRVWKTSWRLVGCLLVSLLVAVGPVALVLGTPQVNFIDEASHYCQRFTFLAFVVILCWGAWALERWHPRLAQVSLLALFVVGWACGRQQVRSWVHDGRVTQAAAVAFQDWWDKPVIYASDIPRQLHLGMIKINTRRADHAPDRVARVIPAWPGAISREDPIVKEADTLFVESLRTGQRILSREAFLEKYGRP